MGTMEADPKFLRCPWTSSGYGVRPRLAPARKLAARYCRMARPRPGPRPGPGPPLGPALFLMVGSGDTGGTHPLPAPNHGEHLPPSTGAAAASATDAHPKKPAPLVLKIRQQDGIIYAEDEERRFYAECEPAEASAFVLPPPRASCAPACLSACCASGPRSVSIVSKQCLMPV